MMYVVGFLVCGIVIVIAGTALARSADAIAEVTGMGRVWIGSVLLAAATSLPELTTGVAAVRFGAVDLAAGDLFGASMANMLILAAIDLLPPRRQLLQQVTLDHALAACLAISLNAVAAVLVLVRPEPSLLWIGPGSLFLFLAYVAGTHAVYRHATRDARAARAPAEGGAPASLAVPAEPSAKQPAMSLRRAVVGFVGAALVVLVAAPVFAWSAKGIAAITGLGETFVGTWLLGVATALPELVTAIAAVRIGAFDLAVGNLFGSSAFNMALFLPLDLAQPGSLFAVLDPGHAVSALFAVVLMSLGLAAIVYRAKRRFSMLEPGSALMLVAYVLALWLLYHQSVGR
jgi:cation:H+ antiporter